MKIFHKNIISFNILSPKSLFSFKNYLNEIRYWGRVLNRPNGWHYDLDIIWILNKLNEYKIKPGDWILDAGAGQGLLQFFLAAKGYNIISYDYSARKILYRAKNIFNISYKHDQTNYKHDYMSHIKYAPDNKNVFDLVIYLKNCGLKLFLKNIFRWFRGYFYFIYEIIFVNKSNYGKIIMFRGSFQEISKFNFNVQAIVSLSAIEHCNKEEIPSCLDELFTKLQNGPMLITTSVHSDREDKYEDYFQSWTFGIKSLLNFFNIKVDPKAINLAKDQINKNRILWKRLDSSYFERKQSYFKKIGKINVPYIPIGISYFKKK